MAVTRLAADDAQCFVALYSAAVSYITDP